MSYVAVALDYKLDESYTPSKMSVRAGTGHHDLKELKLVEVTEPVGWQIVQLEGPEYVPTPLCLGGSSKLMVSTAVNHLRRGLHSFTRALPMCR